MNAYWKLLFEIVGISAIVIGYLVWLAASYVSINVAFDSRVTVRNRWLWFLGGLTSGLFWITTTIYHCKNV